MPYEIFIAGSLGAVVSLGAFGGAVRETLRLSTLRELFNEVLSEPVPEDILVLVKSLGGDEDGDRVE